MNIYTHLSTGKYHPTNCEDYLYQHFLGDNLFIGAVMDGCSSGKESYFASALFGKSLHKSCRMLPNMKEILPDFDYKTMDKEAIGTFILKQLFEDVKKTKRMLFLDTEEILSTLILLVLDLKDNTAWINISGDGLIVCNGQISEIDQNNIPDYLSYHLDKKFDDWYNKHTQIFDFEDVSDISISTDGISKLIPTIKNAKKVDVVESFLVRKFENASKNVLDNLRHNLITNEGYLPYDDMGIIRIIP